MVVPVKFRTGSDGSITTYNFIDIASGTGYATFYAGRTSDAWLLSNFTFYGNETSQEFSKANDVTFTKMGDLDFDVLMNRPLTFRGNAIIHVPMGLRTDGSGTAQAYIIVKIRKWNGATETEIANQQGTTRSETGAVAVYSSNTMDITIPVTHFKRGEYLRLTVEYWGSISTGANTIRIGAYYDPNGTTLGSSTVPSYIKCELPIRIDL